MHKSYPPLYNYTTTGDKQHALCILYERRKDHFSLSLCSFSRIARGKKETICTAPRNASVGPRGTETTITVNDHSRCSRADKRLNNFAPFRYQARHKIKASLMRRLAYGLVRYRYCCARNCPFYSVRLCADGARVAPPCVMIMRIAARRDAPLSSSTLRYPL